MSRGLFAIDRKLIGITRAISDNTNLEVVFKGNVPCTTGKVLVLPNMPADMDSSMFNVYVGYINHEAGHVLYSNFDPVARERQATRILAKSKKYFKLADKVNLSQAFIIRLENFVEDLVIEHKMARKYKGASHYLSNMIISLLDKQETASTPSVHPFLAALNKPSLICQAMLKAIDAGYAVNFPGRENLLEHKSYKDLRASNPHFDTLFTAINPVFKQIAKDPDSDKNEDRIVEILRRLAKTLQEGVHPDKKDNNDKKGKNNQPQRSNLPIYEKEQDEGESSGQGSGSSPGGEKTSKESKGKEAGKPDKNDESGQEESDSGADSQADRDSQPRDSAGAGPEGGREDADSKPKDNDSEKEEADDNASSGENTDKDGGKGDKEDQKEDSEKDNSGGRDDSSTDLPVESEEQKSDYSPNDASSNGGGGKGLSLSDDQATNAMNEMISKLLTDNPGLLQDAIKQMIDNNSDNYVQSEPNFGLNTPSLNRHMPARSTPSDIIKQAKLASASFKRTFINNFLAFQTKTRKTHQPEGVLDIKRAGRLIMAADTNIFKLEKKFKRVNTAVHLTIDCSGSMTGNVKTVQKISYAISDAIKSTNVSYSFSVYDTSMKMVKTDRQRMTDSMINEICAVGGTDLAKAVLTAGQYLRTLRKERNILFALTDGIVDSNTIPIDRLLMSNGIEVYYILVSQSLMGAESLRQISPIEKTRSVAFGGDFTKEFFSKLQLLLRTGHLYEEKPTAGRSPA